MSYLDPLRLHFTGQFQAAPSTVNNDITHFNNATFKPQYQERQISNEIPNGWWNPSGDAVFRLADCNVVGAYRSGIPLTSDPVLLLKVSDTSTKPPAKMVDLDPEQQMVSQIWGMQICLCTSDGTHVMCSDFDLTSFTELWTRDITDDQHKVGDSVFSAMYQTTLSNVKWFSTESSPFLEALRSAGIAEGLSIKFNVDGYNMAWGTPLFTYGRIVGTIGPYYANEPKRFTLGRHLVPTQNAKGQQLYPVNFCSAVVNTAISKVLIDLGNALPTNGIGGPQTDEGALSLVYQEGAEWKALGTVDYLSDGWYTNTAGVVAVPTDRTLTPAELAVLNSSPIGVMLLRPDTVATEPALVEPVGGQYVRADQFVFRLNPGEHADVDLWCTQWGKLKPHAGISVAADNSGLQVGSGWPAAATPLKAIAFPTTLTADANGRATLTIKASDPGNPRSYIDGQVYGVRPLPANVPVNYIVNPWDFISLLVWDQFNPTAPITWYGSMQPIFQQYANLYPIMARFLDLASYEQISSERNLKLLRLAFGLDMTDPNSMPVTRDLSGSRRTAILKWLTDVGTDGKPLLGALTVPSVSGPMTNTELLDEAPAESLLTKGGKMAAMSRRIGMRQTSRKEPR